MKKKSEIKIGIILSYVYIVVSVLAGLLYMPRMVAMLGDSEYGLYGLAKAVIEYLAIMGLGLQSALVRFTAKYVATGEREKEARLGGMFLIIYSIIAVIVMIAGIFLSQNLGILETKLTSSEISRLSILVLILSFNLAIGFPMGVFGGVITAHERFTFRNIVSIAREVMLPIVTLLFLHFGYRSIGMVVIHTVFNVVVLLLDLFYARLVIYYKPIFNGFDKGVVKEIVGYTVFIFIGEVTDRISSATNSTILAMVSGTTAIAVFTVGAQLHSYYLNFSASISSFFLPRVVGMTVKNASNHEISDLFIKVARVQFFVIILIYSGFVAFGRNFIHLWIGDGYLDAYWIAIICMTPTLIGRSQSLGVQVLLARNKHQFRAIFYAFITIVDIALSIPLGMRYGGIGVAVGTGVAQLIGPVITMNIYYAKKIHLDIKQYWKNIIPISLCIAVLTFFGIMMNHFLFANNWWFFALQVAIYVMTYFLFVYNVLLNDFERGLISEFVEKILRKKLSTR